MISTFASVIIFVLLLICNMTFFATDFSVIRQRVADRRKRRKIEGKRERCVMSVVIVVDDDNVLISFSSFNYSFLSLDSFQYQKSNESFVIFLFLIFKVIPSFSRLRELPRSVLERQVVQLIVKLCELMKDVPKVPPLVVEVHISVSYDVP